MLFRTILIIIVIIYLLRLIARYVLPIMLMNFVKKHGQNFQQYQNQNEVHKSKQKEGEVNIDQNASRKSKRISRDKGDYVEFEEVK